MALQTLVAKWPDIPATAPLNSAHYPQSAVLIDFPSLWQKPQNKLTTQESKGLFWLTTSESLVTSQMDAWGLGLWQDKITVERHGG